MKKATKALAVVLTLCLLVTGIMSVSAADAIPNPSYKRPDQTIYKISSEIKLDGVLEDVWKNEAKVIPFTADALKTAGYEWAYSSDSGLTYDAPSTDGYGTAYIGWKEDYILFALEIKDAENTNNQIINNELWKGDCLQLQIGSDATTFSNYPSEIVTDAGIERYEFGFALSSATRRPLGYCWFPIELDLPNAKSQNVSDIEGDMGYYVKHENGTTVYEIALKTTSFGRTAKLENGSVIPFSFAIHTYKDPNPLDENDNGGFHEWAAGVVGGQTTDDEFATYIVGLKNIGSAARLTLGEKDKPTPSTQPPVPTTKKDDTTTTKKDDTNPTDDATPSQDTPVETTPAPTTTTAPDMGDVGVDKNYADADATDVDDEAIISAIKAQMDADKIVLAGGHTMVVKSYVPGVAKFAAPMNDISALYVKDGDSYKQLSGEVYKDADGNETDWYVFDMSELGTDATVYVVKSVAPTTTTTQAPTSKVNATTTAANKTTTTAAAEEEGGSNWWIWVIVVVVVLAVAGVVVFFVLKKKNEDNNDGDEDTSAEG